MRGFVAIVVVALLGCSKPPRARAVGEAGDFAIVDVTVVPMTSEVEVPHRTVVVRGDKVVAIVSADERVASGVTTVDGRDKWLMPGLVDMHVHTWRIDDLTMFVAAGVTTVRNMWGTPLHLDWRKRIASGALFGPTIITSGSLIDGKHADWPGSFELESAEGAEALVVAQQAAGYDFIKVVNRLTPEAYQALARAAEAHHLDVAGHVPWSEGFAGVLAMHQHSIEHLDGVPEELVPDPKKLPSYEEEPDAWIKAIDEQADLTKLPAWYPRMKEAGTWHCPTLIANERTAELGTSDDFAKQTPWLSLVSSAQRALWAHDFATRDASSEQKAQMARLVKVYGEIAAKLVRDDQPVLVGTDVGGPYVLPGESLHEEIEKLVGYGAPRVRVMRAATADAWKYFDEMRGAQPHHGGVIEAGARADLLLVAKDPMQEPLPLVPEGTLLRGVWHPKAELEQRLAEVKARVAGPADPWAGLPPLADATRYQETVDGVVVGVGRVAGPMTQTIDLASGQVTTTRVEGDAIDIAVSHRGMTMSLHGGRAGGKLVVAGTNLVGQPTEAHATWAQPVGDDVAIASVLGKLDLKKKFVELRDVHGMPVTEISAHRFAVEKAGNRTVLRDSVNDETVEVIDGVLVKLTHRGHVWTPIP